MEPKRIAPEILLHILAHIPNPMIQAKLCLLDNQTHALIAPILYNVCDMSKVESVSAFCKAIKGNYSLGRHVAGCSFIVSRRRSLSGTRKLC